MELSARDIIEKKFHDAWRGYHQQEVDDFLDKVAEGFDRVARENSALRRRVVELEQAVAASRNTEEMLKKTLVTAQQAAEEAIAKAKAKAEELVAQAEERARRASEDAQAKATAVEAETRRKTAEVEHQHAARRRELDVEIERLRSFEAELRQRLRAFLQQQLGALDALAERGAPAARRQPQGDVARPGAVPLRAQPRPPREQTEPIAVPDDDAKERRGVRGLFGRSEG